MRRLSMVWVSVLAVVLWSSASAAHSPEPKQRAYSVVLEDESGAPLRTYAHKGKVFVLGRFGQRYTIRLRNRTGRRVEAVVSVDGRDAISGEAANYRDHRGYLVPPHGSVTIDGFRRSTKRVAAFRFTDPGDSYSSRMGTPQNVGVIGVAFFAEKRRSIARRFPHHTPHHDRKSLPHHDRKSEERAEGPDPRPRQRSQAQRGSRRRNPSPPASADGQGSARPAPERRHHEPPNNLGTEYGESRYSPVRTVPFVRASQRPVRLIKLRYDDADGLRARGIRLDPHPVTHPVVPHRPPPRAFPAVRFAPPPP